MKTLNVIIKDGKIHKLIKGKDRNCENCSLYNKTTKCRCSCVAMNGFNSSFTEISINELINLLFDLEKVDLKLFKEQCLPDMSNKQLQDRCLELYEENKLLTSILVQKGIF
jgi:hypothetical protein